MQPAKVRSSLVVAAGLLTALVGMSANRAHAGSEANITNPNAARAAPSAGPAKAASPTPDSQEERRAHQRAEPEKRRAAATSHARRDAPSSDRDSMNKAGCVVDRFGYGSQSGTAAAQCR
jgi:hypothetical protein